MVYLITAFIVSLILTVLIVRFQNLHGRFTADTDLMSTQKFHRKPVPRVGGIALFAAVLAVCGVVAAREPAELGPLLLIWLCSIPAFVSGLAEDTTKRISAKWRFLGIGVSGVLVFFVLDQSITRLNIPLVDSLLQFGFLAFIVTVIAVIGAANAINIIDGYNGLAAVVSIFIFAGFAYVCFYLDDRLLLITCVSMIGAIGGFLIWNYPRGLIFLGDGGAYFIGCMIGIVSIMLLVRHPSVSAWFPLLLCLYPVFETLFSIYRKLILRGHSPGVPDGVHLHMLIYRRLVRWAEPGPQADHIQGQRNAMTSPYLWVFSSLAVVPAVLFWQHQIMLIAFTVLFAVLYVVLYRTLVLFRAPKWLVIKKK